MSFDNGLPLAAAALVVVASTSQLCVDAHHDWAACFPLGRYVADQFAAENGLAVVSEVIPDSNCFQGPNSIGKNIGLGFGLKNSLTFCFYCDTCVNEPFF